MTTPVAGLPFAGPRGLTKTAADLTSSPTDLRMGTVAAVTSRGLDVAVAEGMVEGAAHLSSYNPAVGDPVAMVRYQDAWLVTGRPVGPGTSLDTATPGSAAGTTLLDGMALTGAAGAGIANSTGAVVVVPRYGVTYFHPPGHWVMLWVGYTWYASVLSDWMTVSLKEATGSQTLGSVDHVQNGNVFFGNFASEGIMVPPSFGGKGYSVFMTVQRVSGTGTSRIDDQAARRGYLLALDMGDQAIIRTT